uniref:OSJNBa0020I02.4 protein n=1 Tax=Oryza sativa subsp. japonica TaxID=39947 RepID=Q7XS76_ORYSJ|nr:OSJNBa0020I02.4 [Oryza sativa Japonica Group]
MAERAVAHSLSPNASGDDGEQNPRRRARTPPPPSRRNLGRGEALGEVEGSATSPPAGDGGGRRDGVRRRLVYGDGVTPQGALQAAGALLRHPPVVPDPETLARRWLDDVADLVMTAQQRLGAGGRSSATKASGAAAAGSMSSRRRAWRAAAVTRRSSAIPSSTPPTQEDVRGGPDARLDIERRRDARRAAHATEGASSSGAPLRSGHGGRPPVSPVGGASCRAFVASLRNVRWPPWFRPTITEKYDGSVNPAEFLQIYTTGIEAAGGDDRVMANFFPMALKGQARGWLMNLPPASVHSWEDLCQQFTTNFQGTYPRPGEEADLHARFCQVRNTIPCIPAHAVIYAFRGGVRHNRMLEKIASKEPQITAQLFELADRVARKEEAWTWNSSGSGVAAPAAPGSAARSGRRDRRRKKGSARSDDEGHVLAVEGASRAPRKGRPVSDKKKEAGAPSRERPTGKWCTVHNTSLHDLADCRAVKSLAERTRKWEEEKRQERREGKTPAAPAGNRRDGGAALNILSPAAFDAIKAPGMVLRPSQPIIGVTPGHTWPLGHIDLPVTFGGSANFRTERVDFDVADLSLPYNAVLGRPALVKFMATEDALVSFLRANADVFAWRPADMPGVPREAGPAESAAAAPERQAFIREEVARLLEAGFIREVIHPEWLANPVVVPKANGKLRMCIDYTDLNKACPKDPYPLPRIDQIVDSTAGCDLLCFLDAYSGYHQIRMAREDEEKTAFITPIGTYCYTTMPFGLKNAGPTFQHTTRISLGSQIGRNVEAYVDDLVVKTRNQEALLSDLAETFESLRSARIKLNPDKCVFGVPAGKLLRFLVSARGIEANPEKIRAIERMRPPSKLRDVQCVTGCLAALSRFISRLGEKALPLFKLLKRSGPFTWTEEAERAFTQLKAYLSSSPVLVAPEPDELLLLYLAATPQVVSAALVVERDEDNPHSAHPHPVSTRPGREQGGEPPSRTAARGPRRPELALRLLVRRCQAPPTPKMAPGPLREGRACRPLTPRSSAQKPSAPRVASRTKSALEMRPLAKRIGPAARKLRHYFQAHRVTVVTSYPLGQILHNREGTGRVVRWAIELSEFDLRFEPRHAIKSQALADFVAEWTPAPEPVSAPEASSGPPQLPHTAYWVMQFDGSLSLQGAGAGVTLTSPSGDVLRYLVRLDFRATNNMAEYEGLLVGLRVAAGLGIRRLLVLGDSQLVVNQAYLANKTLPEDREGSERVRRISKRYVLVEGTLYRRAANGVLLKCIPREQGVELLADVHEGECRAHSASRTLVGKAFRQGFYWPTALNDAVDLVRRCRACQFHARQTNQPAQALQTIPLSWPFAVWGLDILGPFRRAPGRFEYLYVAVDKFTKWPEAYPVIKIDKHSALKFIRGITARFGVPNRIITDNGTQFTSELFGDYCEDMGIKLCFASPAHPRSNGQVERANAEILKGLKTKTFNILKKHGDSWIEELPAVLWANRTTPSRATGETPFFLVYGAEAVLPSELTLRSPWVTMYCEADQDQLRRDDLDYLEERRRRAALRATRYQQSLRRYHQRHVRARSLYVDDLVLRRVQTRAGLSKLSPMWEGPYRVIGVPRPGSVRLATGDGTELPNPWNIEHLRRFYP